MSEKIIISITKLLSKETIEDYCSCEQIAEKIYELIFRKEKAIIEIFDRFNYRDDIERELESLGFEVFFGDPDEKIYFTPNEPHEILVYVNWIDGTFWIYKRIEKIEH